MPQNETCGVPPSFAQGKLLPSALTPPPARSIGWLLGFLLLPHHGRCRSCSRRRTCPIGPFGSAPVPVNMVIPPGSARGRPHCTSQEGERGSIPIISHADRRRDKARQPPPAAVKRDGSHQKNGGPANPGVIAAFPSRSHCLQLLPRQRPRAIRSLKQVHRNVQLWLHRGAGKVVCGGPTTRPRPCRSFQRRWRAVKRAPQATPPSNLVFRRPHHPFSRESLHPGG